MNKKEKTQYNKEIRTISKSWVMGEFENVSEYFGEAKIIKDKFDLTDRTVLDDMAKQLKKYEKHMNYFYNELDKKPIDFKKIDMMTDKPYFLIDGINFKNHRLTPVIKAVEIKSVEIVELLAKRELI